MSTTRVAYLERDAALRGFVTRTLEQQPRVEISVTLNSVAEALAADLTRVDAVLLDLDLGPMEVSGIELGIALRERVPSLGVVLFTQTPVPDLTRVLPEGDQRGWSVVGKTVEVDGALLAEALASTARGLNIIDPMVRRVVDGPGSGASLTPRQRRIMALAAQGLDGKSIAVELGLAAVTVRQELSRVYSLLVPDARQGIDLRTLAVVRYLRGGGSTVAVTG